MTKMATPDMASSEYFTVGSLVTCVTCLDSEVEGEVLAYDQHAKMLIIKSPSSSNRSTLNNIHMVNLQLVKDVTVKKEMKDTPPTLPSLNIPRLNARAKEQIDKKQKLVAALRAGVSPEGQRLFVAINKTIDEVSWHGEDIMVMKNVKITPPYKPENVRGNMDSKALIHVRKIVEKHLKDRESLAESSSSGGGCRAPSQ
jgi:hypothetical protein